VRLTLVAIGSRGDVQPIIALGRGLAGGGHDVRVLAHPEFRALAEGAGVTFVEARGQNPRELLEGPEGRAFLSAAKTPRGYAKRFAELAGPAVGIGFEDTLRAAEGTDAVLYQPTAFGGFNVAEKLGIPAIQLQLQPFVRTSAHPSVFVPRRSLGRLGNRISHVLSERMLSYALREPLNRARKEVLDLPPLTSRNSAGDRVRLDAGRLLGFSGAVVPPAPDWPPATFQTGYWMDDDPEDWSPDPALESFLAGPGPVVFFGLGSMVLDDPDGTTRTVVEAARRSGVRIVLQRGWGGFGESAEGDHVHVVGEAPHGPLFRRVDAVVHHGGAGTTARALAAGKPGLAVPVIADQWFWGYRIQALGAGPAPLPATKITVEKLRERLQTLTSTPAFTTAASDVAARLREDDPMRNACAAVERLVPATAGV
jgi:sterol 3beta-glucosyltransferase